MPLRVPSNDSKSLTLFSDEHATKVRVHPSLLMPLKAATTPCTRCRGLHTRRLPTSTTELYNQSSSSENVQHHFNRLGFQEPKSNKPSSFHSNESSPRTQTDAPNAMARTQEVLKSFTPKFHQSYKSLWGNKRGRTKEENNKWKPQDLDLLCSPYTKEIWIGGNVDLDLLSNFPQEYARIMGGMGRNGKLFKG